MAVNRWLAIRIDFYTALITGSSAIFVILSKEINYTNNPALMGIAMINIFKITGLISFTLSLISNCSI